MKKVSYEFKDNIKGVFDRETTAKIVFYMTETVGSNMITGSESIGINGQIFDEVIETNNWATFEPGRFKLDGSFSIPAYTSKKEYGYISSAMSDEEGNIDVSLTISFEKPQNSIGMTLVFQEIVYDFNINIDGTVYEVTGNTNLKYELDEEVQFSTMTIIFKKLEPNRRVRLLEIFFGKILEYTDDDLFGLNIINEVSIISDTLPIDSLDFRIVNNDMKFDLLNPLGIYRKLKERQVVKPYIGVNIGNTFEYTQMGRYYLKEWSTDDIEASFVAYSIVDILDNETYTYGKLEQRNLYNMIVELLDGIADYDIDLNLKGINVLGCIGLVTKREALRLMAQAGNCIVVSDETGKLIIKKIENIKSRNVNLRYSGEYYTGQIIPEVDLAKRNLYISSDDMYSYPQIVQTKPYTGVKVSISNFSMDSSAEEVTLYDGIVKIPTVQRTQSEYKVWVSYNSSPATNVVIVGADKYDIYAYGCYVYIKVDTEIFITGKTVNVNTDYYSVGETENLCTIDNILISDKNAAINVAENVLNDYDLQATIDYRGYAYLDSGDNIIVETQYGDHNFCLTKQTFEYDGTLSSVAEGVGTSG